MTDAQTGRRVRLTDDDIFGIKKLVTSAITRVFTGVVIAGVLGAVSLVISLYVNQAKQEESNRTVLEKIDYKYERLAEGQRESKEQVRLIVAPLEDRLKKTERMIEYLLRNHKQGNGSSLNTED